MTLQTRPQSVSIPAAEARVRVPEASVSCQSVVSSSAQVSQVVPCTSRGLQRARVRALTLRAETLRPAATTPLQMTLDPADDRALHLEAAVDRARARFGPTLAKPAVDDPVGTDPGGVTSTGGLQPAVRPSDAHRAFIPLQRWSKGKLGAAIATSPPPA
ncbi:hypothetical protein [Streptomyces albipurpureus]|uniref:Uncharacterized protein n=1 Tax=Streptomyces albipurpureus TaxID=2897419 RepID=A0ABT0UIC7_9ACTN|nr:hypothetical protein [Streptomyces sp. CWNU-1]MCM2387370.1 hypothetical protein [Streptomyces sp. CWNU-1]